RDAMMAELDREYPGYGFAAHKGYPTAEHRDAVVKLGPSAVHRMSFPVIHELRGEFTALFYVLRKHLFESETRAALAGFETAFKAREGELPEAECRKLRLLLTRRWKLVRQ